MPARFDKLGICFEYPENWTLDEADAEAGRHAVTVYSPSGAFWSVAVHPRSADPAELAKGVVQAMQEEYETLEAEEICENFADVEVIGYDMDFYFIDFLNAAQIRSLRLGSATYTIFCQAEDREFERLQAVFRAMTASLLSHVR